MPLLAQKLFYLLLKLCHGHLLSSTLKGRVFLILMR
nr:MAG TPA: hypothetical protein [Caudoviricetes sp.]